jgi:hypothetical protein
MTFVVESFHEIAPDLITEEVLKAHERALKHVDKGCLSDHPGVSLYCLKANGKYICSRGTNQCENFHSNIAESVKATSIRAEIYDLLLSDYVTRWNIDRAVGHDLNMDFNSYNLRLLWDIQNLYEKYKSRFTTRVFAHSPPELSKSDKIELFGCRKSLQEVKEELKLLAETDEDELLFGVTELEEGERVAKQHIEDIRTAIDVLNDADVSRLLPCEISARDKMRRLLNILKENGSKDLSPKELMNLWNADIIKEVVQNKRVLYNPLNEIAAKDTIEDLNKRVRLDQILQEHSFELKELNRALSITQADVDIPDALPPNIPPVVQDIPIAIELDVEEFVPELEDEPLQRSLFRISSRTHMDEEEEDLAIDQALDVENYQAPSAVTLAYWVCKDSYEVCGACHYPRKLNREFANGHKQQGCPTGIAVNREAWKYKKKSIKAKFGQRFK